MADQFSRTRMIIGDAAQAALHRSRVLVFGVGGVGSFAVEALARAGVGTLALVDHDTVDITNINRQLYALHSTVGRLKVEIARARILDINPAAEVAAHPVFLSDETAQSFDFGAWSYVVDAIDTVSAKLLLAERCAAAGTPLISAMGAGNRLIASFEVADIYKTSGCPLARVMRRELKRRGIPRLKVVFSRDEPVRPAPPEGDTGTRRAVPGSISFGPATAGMVLAGEVIRDLIKTECE